MLAPYTHYLIPGINIIVYSCIRMEEEMDMDEDLQA